MKINRLKKSILVWYRLHTILIRSVFAIAVLALAASFWYVSDFEIQEKTFKAVQKNDLSACDSVEGRMVNGVDYGVVCRNNIARAKALTEGNSAYCDLLDNKLMSKDVCVKEVLAQKVVKEQSLTVCDGAKTEDQKEVCTLAYWQAKAVEDNNIGLCAQNIKQTNLVSSCEREVFLDAASRGAAGSISCASLGSPVRENCEAFQIAVSNDFSSDKCFFINDNFLRNLCLAESQKSR